MLVQRTRSSPRALREPLTRRPLGTCGLCVVLVFGVALAWAQAAYARQTAEDEVRAALASFIEAFNNLNWESFQSWIALDATLFNPEIPETSDLSRVDGKEAIARSFRSVFERSKRGVSGPPYLHIVPEKVKVQMLDRAAVVTFEFERNKGSVGRRTIVFRQQAEGWRIVHIHASNTSAHD